MTRDEMLKRMGLNEHEFKQLVERFRDFYGNLNAAQQAVVNHALPGFRQAVGLFGADIRKEDVKALLTSHPQLPGAPPPAPPPPGTAGAFGQNGLNNITNGGDGDGNGNGQ